MSDLEKRVPLGRAERLYRYLSRAFVFIVLLFVAFFALNSFFQPVWFYENNYHTYRSFYKEPSNSIETVFVGASMTLFGFSPMEIYEQNGICSFNLASTSQPYLMSYYWVKEAERLHSETLDTVVLDVSMLRRTPQEGDYRKALDGMQWSSNKAEAINDLSDSFIDQITYRFPIFGYHDRWSQLDFTDFVKYDADLEDYARGYYMEFNRIFDDYEIGEIGVPAQVNNPEASPIELQKESLFYLNKLIEFCEDKNIRLVFCKTPSPSNWSANEHNTIQQIADAYDIDFLDFEMEPLLSEIGYCPPLDSKDLGKHLNYYGAMKLSHYLGNYLATTCGNRDVRNIESYRQHLDDQLERYHKKVTLLAEATLSDDVADCMTKIASATNYTMLITVKGSATGRLAPEQRLVFDKLGLKELSTLRSQDSYMAVMTNGAVEFEQIDRMPNNLEDQVNHYIEEYKRQVEEEELPEDIDEEEPIDRKDLGFDEIEQGEWEDTEDQRVALVRTGQLDDGTKYTLKSFGQSYGAISSCLIETLDSDVEYSVNGPGINITVYDNDVHRVVYSTSFNTNGEQKRESPDLESLLVQDRYSSEEFARMSDNLKKLYRYRRRMDYGIEAKTLRLEIGTGGLYKYLQHFSRDGLIVLIAVKDDAATALSYEAREALAGMGLTEVLNLDYQGSYCAAIEDGAVVSQSLSNEDGQPATIVNKWYTLESGGYHSGNLAYIKIEDDGYNANSAPNGRGFNVVVYNPRLSIVVDRAFFDTCATGVDL